METSLLVILLAFYWLGRETKWLTIRLLVGAIKPDRKGLWQFEKYGDDCIMMQDRCYVERCRQCKKIKDRWFGWRIPARTVKIAGSTITFKAGCNLYRAKLLKDICKSQRSKAAPTYRPQGQGRCVIVVASPEFELLVGGNIIMSRGNGDGNYKPGEVKAVMSKHITPIKVGRRTIKVDLVTTI